MIVIDQCCYCVELFCGSDLFFDVAKLVISDTLLGSEHCGLNGLYNSAAVEGYAEMLYSTLDNSNFCCVINLLIQNDLLLSK